jgi:hypothetical protein
MQQQAVTFYSKNVNQQSQLMQFAKADEIDVEISSDKTVIDYSLKRRLGNQRNQYRLAVQ